MRVCVIPGAFLHVCVCVCVCSCAIPLWCAVWLVCIIPIAFMRVCASFLAVNLSVDNASPMDDVYYYICWRPVSSQARRGDGEYGRLHEGAEGRNSRGTHGHSLH